MSFDDISVRHALKVIITLGAILMLFLWYLLMRRNPRRSSQILFDFGLVVLALASVVAYFEFGWLRYNRYMNPHDVYHYYMGAKYSLEHHYYDLYRTTLIADHELGAKYNNPQIRNLENHRFEATRQVLNNKAKYVTRFSPERWEEYKGDVAYWRTVMPGYKWNALLRDKGYNATPVWNSIARTITDMIPTSSIWGMRFLNYIDLAFLSFMFVVIGIVFGWRTMLFALIFHCVNYFMAFVHIKGAFMRLDWLCASVVGLCLLKSRYYGTAGVFFAYATMARVFPLLFLFGLGIKGSCNVFRNLLGRFNTNLYEPINRNYILLFATFSGACILFFALSVAADSGTHLWTTFFEKISIHNQDISTNRAGFKYVFLGWSENKAASFQEFQQYWRLILLVALGITAWSVRKVNDYEAVALGFIPVFFLTAPTFYYFVMLLVPMLYFLPKIQQGDRLMGAVLMFSISILGYVLSFNHPHHFFLFFNLSFALLSLCLYMIISALRAPFFSRLVPTALAEVPEHTSASSSSEVLENADAGIQPEGSETASLQSKSDAATSGEASMVIYGEGYAKSSFFLSWGKFMIFTLVFLGCAIAFGFFAASEKFFATPSTSPSAHTEYDIAEDAVQLLFVGDVMLSRNVARSIRENNRLFDCLFEPTREIVSRADVAFANLESPISGRGTALKGKNYLFNAPPESVKSLAASGFKVLSLANNHILDYGPIAMEDTIRLLSEHQLHGIGITEENAPQVPLILEVKGVRLGFLAYCDPVPRYSYAREFYAFLKRPATGDRETLARDIQNLRPQVDILIVSMHWGIEYQMVPDDHQRALGHFIIDSGADILAGHHQHVQQEPEFYNNGLILHGMGNFIFDQHTRPPTLDSRIFRVYVNKERILRVEYLPASITPGEWRPVPLEGEFISLEGLVKGAG